MTRKELESIFYMKKELKMWQNRYRDLVLDIAPPVKNVDGMPFSQTFNTRSPVEEKAIKLTETSEEINNMIDRLTLAIHKAERFIVTIEDSLIRQIVELRCVYNLKWQQIADTIGGDNTADSVRMQYSRFISDL